MEIKIETNSFTWNNRRKGFCNITEKLDRFFIRGNLANISNTFEAKILPLSGSEHFLVQLFISESIPSSKSPFQFELMWLRDENILKLIEKWWTELRVISSKPFKLITKLKSVKQNLIAWNRN